ncbi:hypothetical protein EG68_03918 [Paragonimus skrjabini miyazakii]|uniref:KIF-binding protein n=1 Tax=Paragonimus skrjabini miyazakii TaxID=59628 RepID=A0A8S9Y886_9TREM|nr:hypothetical protein EG68_03918 [Paragonimus skrjabini miyazakii]
MLQLQQFLEVNTPILSELRNLELIRIKLPSPTSRISLLTRRIYIELLTQFEATFPKPCTSVHFLHWAFIRTRIANTFLECSEPNKAYEWLHVILENTKELTTIHSVICKLQHPAQSSVTNSVDYDKDELILFNLLAGLLQTLFNLLAASAHSKYRAASEPSNTTRDSTLLTHADAITSLDWLQCAKRVHELYVEHNSPYTGPTFWETIVLKDLMYHISGDVSIEETGVDWLPKRLTPERLLFEHGYTNTIFLLAQAYQLADEPVHAAVCCQLTLSRQLSFAQPLKELAQFAKSFPNRSRPRAVSAQRSKDVNQSIFGHMRRRFACYVSWVVQPFDPVEWATNAAALSNYYLSTEEANGYYYATLECLVSACAIIDRADVHVAVTHKSVSRLHPLGDSHKTDRERKARANIYRGLGLFGLSLLEKGSMTVMENPKLLHECIQTSTNLHPAEEFGSMFQLRLGQFLRRLVSDVNVDEPTSLTLTSESDSQKKLFPMTANGESASVETYVNMLATCPTTYDAAALVFRLTSYGLSQASQYYTMDEHCSDAVVIGQNLSKAYRLMATFELNESRQCCIHKRRIDLLDRLLRPLSQKHYQLLCRQLMFELAGALTTLRDLKHQAYEHLRDAHSERNPHYARKANALARRTLTVYQQFLATFPRSGSQSFSTEALSEDELRLVMLAHFYSARLHSKMIPANRTERISNVTKAFNQYNYVVSLVDSHLRRHPTSNIGQAEEVNIAREMVSLLPIKLNRLARGEHLND